MEPEVRYLIVCDEVRADPANLHRVDILGLMSVLRSTASPPLPLVRPLFCVLVLLRTGDAAGLAGNLEVRIVQGSTGRVVFRTQPRATRFVHDPEQTAGIVFRIRNSTFPGAGYFG